MAGVLVRVTVKLAPSLPIAEGTASGWSAPFAIVTAFALAALRSCRFPSMTAPAAAGGGLAAAHVTLADVAVPPVAAEPDQFREVARTVVVGVVGRLGAVTPVLPGWVFESILHAPFCSTSE